MAQEVVVKLTDDIDGTAAAETVSFGVDGVAYMIDLSEANAQKLREAFGEWVAYARKARPGKTPTGGRRRRVQNNESQAIREWAATQGIPLAPRGRIPQHVLDRYHRQAAAA